MPAAEPPRTLRVVFATDGEQAADGAAELFSAVARRPGTEVLVTSVAPTRTPTVGHLRSRFAPLDERRRRASTVASAAADDLRRAGFAAVPATSEGRPAAAISRTARSHDADVVLVGAANHGVIGRLLGSVSEAVVSRCRSSVLVVREPLASHPTEVIVAVDDDGRAERAVAMVARLLDPARCHLTVLGVAAVLAPSLSPPHVRYAGDEGSRHEASEVRYARREVAGAASRLREAGFDVDERVVVGEPVGRILAEAEERRAGLVVVASRGLGAVDSVLVGSVSRAVVAEAPATLIVRS